MKITREYSNYMYTREREWLTREKKLRTTVYSNIIPEYNKQHKTPTEHGGKYSEKKNEYKIKSNQMPIPGAVSSSLLSIEKILKYASQLGRFIRKTKTIFYQAKNLNFAFFKMNVHFIYIYIIINMYTGSGEILRFIYTEWVWEPQQVREWIWVSPPPPSSSSCSLSRCWSSNAEPMALPLHSLVHGMLLLALLLMSKRHTHL